MNTEVSYHLASFWSLEPPSRCDGAVLVGRAQPTSGIPDAAQRTRAATDDYREAPLESDDGVNAPPANELLGKCVYVFAKRLTLSNGQIQNAADHQPLRNIEAIQAALSVRL